MGVSGPVAGAILGSAGIGFLGSQSAAQTQANSAANATAAQESMFGVQQGNLAPFRQAGVGALGQIQSNLPAWNANPTSDQILAQDPGYAFRLAQGNTAVEGSAAARGGLVNGGTLASLSNYSQNQASGEYGAAFDRYQQQINNSYNRLFGVANLGQTAASGVSAAAGQVGQSIGQNTIGAGNAAAAGQIGQANALTGAIGQGVQQYNTGQFMNKLFPQQSSPATDASMGSQYQGLGYQTPQTYGGTGTLLPGLGD